MKTYIFITRSICKIGGSYQYILNKTLFLEKRGWKVIVFSGLRGDILLKDFQKYKKYVYTPLYYTPDCSRKSIVKETLNNLVKDIDCIGGEECVIESNYCLSAVWAELLAARINCRHLAFLLQEKHQYDDNMSNFLRFKYNRHELAGIVEDSITQMFNDKTVEKRRDTCITAYCTNVISECVDDYSHVLQERADCTIGYFGRLVKPCVPSIVKGICSYVNKNKDLYFNVVFVGGSTVRGKEEIIRDDFRCFENVNLIFTGNVYPLPLSFARKFNVFISTSGAAVSTFMANIPTVMVNPVSGQPVGVIGLDYDLAEKTMYNSSSDLTIEGCIEKAIKQKDRIRFKNGFGDEYYKKMDAEFERQLSFVNIAKENGYYDETLLLKLKMPLIRFKLLHRFVGCLFGADMHEIILKRLGKIQ